MNREQLVERVGPLLYRSDWLTQRWNELRLHRLDGMRGKIREAKFAWLTELELSPGCILDVGANFGQSAIAMRHHRPDRSVLCIEANPDLRSCLQRLTRRDPEISFLMVGAGAEWGEADLTIPQFHGSSNAGGATLDPDFLTGRAEELEQRYGAQMMRAVRTIPVMPLAALDTDVCAIKIDVEGLELDVLIGLGSMIQPGGSQPPVLVEVRHSDGEAMRYLEAQGYRFHALEGMGEIGRVVRVDEALALDLHDVLAVAD